MRIKDLKILFWAMLGVVSVLVVGAGHIWFQPYLNIAAREVANWKPVEDFSPSEFATLKPLKTLSEAINRPLFRQSRKPFDPSLAVAAAVVPDPAPAIQLPVDPPPPDYSQLVVKGIFFDGSSRLALIATPDAPDGVWLAQGADVQGWKIAALDENGVTLSASGQTHEIKLYVDNTSN